MTLQSLPIKIYDANLQLLQQNQLIRRLQQQVAAYEAEVATAVAFDSDLKNEAQRKAKATELLKQPDHLKALEELHVAKDRAVHIEIHLTYLNNLFKVECLLAQQSIAMVA